MSLTFGPSYLDTPIESASQVTVTTWDGRPADLTSPVEVGPHNDVTFTVATGGRYTIKVRTDYLEKDYSVYLAEDPYDPSDPRQYVDAKVADLQEQIDAGGGGGGGGVPPSRTLTAGTGLTGGGDLSANRTFSLSAASQESLAKADTAVQPSRSLTAGTGLTGGGNLSADRTFSLSAETQASLAKADTSLQPGSVTAADVGAVPIQTTGSRVYTTDSNGTGYLLYSTAASANTIVQRSTGGAVNVGTPTQTTHATTKSYVDGALDLKANLASPTFTGTVSGITKAMVGLPNVDDTSDANKPVSTAQQTALNLKANLASPTFTGTVSGITKAMVGLSNVDNTADSAKPVSTAQQTALNLKANLASPTFTGTVSGITKAMVGLGNVDNTSDANKPVSTATQTALNAKVTNGGGVATAVRMTQAAYDALGTKDENTLYVIVG